jgi:exosortase K
MLKSDMPPERKIPLGRLVCNCFQARTGWMCKMIQKISFRIKNLLILNAWAYATMLTAAYALKYHYAHAGCRDLIWILAPTAKLAGWFLQQRFVFDPHAGYISPETHICIAPACAGVNFLIILFCMTAWIGIYYLKTCPAKGMWILTSAVLSYCATVWVNACRIYISVCLFASDFYRIWINPETMHQLMGIMLYLGCLYGFFCITQSLFLRYGLHQNKLLDARGDGQRNGSISHLLPLMVYLSITVLVPLLHNAHKLYDRQFCAHSLWIIGVGMGIYGLIIAGRIRYLRIKDK